MGAGASTAEIHEEAHRKQSTADVSWTKFEALPPKGTMEELNEAIGVCLVVGVI